LPYEVRGVSGDGGSRAEQVSQGAEFLLIKPQKRLDVLESTAGESEVSWHFRKALLGERRPGNSVLPSGPQYYTSRSVRSIQSLPAHSAGPVARPLLLPGPPKCSSCRRRLWPGQGSSRECMPSPKYDDAGRGVPPVLVEGNRSRFADRPAQVPVR